MKQCFVKIVVSTDENYTHIDDVVYYRNGMSPDFLARWMWFFVYLAARVEVANPRRRVKIYHGPADINPIPDFPEYINKIKEYLTN